MTAVKDGLFGLVGMLLVGMLILMSTGVHPEALDVQDTIDSKFNSDCKPGLYYSPMRGMLLIVADMGSGISGGQIWKFTEQRFGELIPCDKIYESTCFSADQGYWCRVIKRDGYISLGAAKWVVGGGIFIALGALCAILRHLGRDELADGIGDA